MSPPSILVVFFNTVLEPVRRIPGSGMAAEERAAAPVRGALFRGHRRHGRRPRAAGGVHRGLPHREHGQRLGEAGQPAGRAPPPPPVRLLDARAAVLVHASLVHGARAAGRQADDRGAARAGRPHIHR